MKGTFFLLTCLLWLESLSFAQGYRLPSTVAEGLLKSSAEVTAVSKGRKIPSLAVSSAQHRYLRTLAKNDFYDLDVMLRDYFLLNPQAASSVQVVQENERLQEALVKQWLDRDFYASSRQDQLRAGLEAHAVQGKIDYVQYIPYNTRLVLLGEVHEEDWMSGGVEEAVMQFKRAYPDKNIYYASEFIDAAAGEGLYFLTKEKDADKFVLKRPYYRPLTKRMIAAGVNVVGLENPEFSQELTRNDRPWNFTNTPLAWKTVSVVGMRERNAYWARIIRRIYAQDPDAVVFVHAGLGHTDYNHPHSLAGMLKAFRPFVVEFSAPKVGDFNTLLERNLPLTAEALEEGWLLYKTNPQKPIFYIRYMKDKRSALVAGCDLHIKKIKAK